MADADLLEEGRRFKRIRAWLTVLTDDTYTVLDWFEPGHCGAERPESAQEARGRTPSGLRGGSRRRDEPRRSRQGAGNAADGLDELLRHVQGYATVAVTEFLEGMAGVAAQGCR